MTNAELQTAINAAYEMMSGLPKDHPAFEMALFRWQNLTKAQEIRALMVCRDEYKSGVPIADPIALQKDMDMRGGKGR